MPIFVAHRVLLFNLLLGSIRSWVLPIFFPIQPTKLFVMETITLTHQTSSIGVQSLNGVWKVLFNAAYKFEIENGANQETAEFLALQSIHKKMHTAKKLRSTEFGH